MRDVDKSRFGVVCADERASAHATEKNGIGLYKEKHVHRVVKNFLSDNTAYHERPVGSYIADVLIENDIYEIQTGSFKPLCKKIKYYLNNTTYNVTVIYPVIVKKTIIQMNKETGEIQGNRVSPSHGVSGDLLSELYYMPELFGNERLRFFVFLISADEQRYSERMRYRKDGRYDNELFPTELIEIREYSAKEDLFEFVPENINGFTVKEYSRLFGIKGRAVYSALNFLCMQGLLERRKDGRKYVYFK